MPIIGGRYYMNPQYGAALERDRAANPPDEDQLPIWLDQFLGFVSKDTDSDTKSEGNDASDDIVQGGPEETNVSDFVAQNQNSETSPQAYPQTGNAQKVPDIAGAAEKYDGSNDWAFGARKGPWGPNTNKCNEYVGDVVKEAGAPAYIRAKDGSQRYPLAAEWADPKTNIPGWRVLGSGETPQRGDVAAYKLPGGGMSYSGHSGIVVGSDSHGPITIAAHNYVNPGHDQVGPADHQFAEHEDPMNPVVYRRYVGP